LQENYEEIIARCEIIYEKNIDAWHEAQRGYLAEKFNKEKISIIYGQSMI
jgi:hypothetical protein